MGEMTALPAPIKKMIHELVCKELDSSTDEDKVAAAVCTRVHDKFKLLPESLCEMAVQKAWEGADKRCTPSEMTALPAPIEKMIHELVCKELDSSTDEDR